ncbi:helix-turn-helix transcriptional regulator [Solwaraspora sp. WMMD791]|uniref:helix-turn-helix domain-containing protein n=1 Tax=Solwaraspora sp. WMMD791 TaxID=3016086 RepID=UPI002499B0C1|nr:helix-turn-helix transcriptional regulator [Solwaraspora sp. WMMD791]WFE26889.1 helix-turn-helix transcriptional regulator [Solwaraspora sp. WMMD791]
MPEDYIGLRVARWRDIAGMTQQQLAAEIGVSREYVSMIENGKRAVTKRSMLIALASALGVSTMDLTAQPYLPRSRNDLALWAAVPAIRKAMDDDEPAVARPPAQLAAEADRAMRARMACDNPTLGILLPRLIAEIRATANAENDPAALRIAVQTLVTGSLALKPQGHVDLAMRLAERAVRAAKLSGDPACEAAADFALAQAVLATGLRKRSWTLARAAAERMQAHLGTDEGRAWYGMLHLHAALSAASLSQHDVAEEHVVEAEEVARRTAGDPWRMEFTPANVAVWRVGVVLENGEPGRAPELARKVDQSALRTPQRRARLHMDAGRGFHAAKRNDEAVRAFLRAEAIAPHETRSRATVREIIAHIVRDSSPRGGSDELRQLAVRMGIDPLSPEDHAT